MYLLLVTSQFSYKYKYQIDNITVCRRACGIDLGTSYVVTGGLFSEQRVTQYSLTGEVTELPDLNTGRCYHACSKFVNTEGVTVSYKYRNVRKLLFLFLDFACHWRSCWKLTLFHRDLHPGHWRLDSGCLSPFS